MPRFCVRSRIVVRDALEVIAAAVALVACVATSSPDGPGVSGSDGGSLEDPLADPVEFEAAAALHNALAQEVVVRVSALRPGVDLDCSRIAEPGALLSEGLFDAPTTWRVPPMMTIPLISELARNCHALRVEGDSFETRVMFWQSSELGWRRWDQDAPAEGTGAVTLLPAGEGTTALGALSSDEGRLWTPQIAPRQTEQCAPAPAATRLDWSDPAPLGEVRIVAVEQGLDGCQSITFAQGEDTLPPWFLCASPEAWPFEAGQTLEAQPLYSAGLEGLTLTASGFEQREGAQLLLARGSEAPAIPGLVGAVVPDEACGFDVDPVCGTASVAGALRVEDETGVELFVSPRTGAREYTAAQGRTVRLEVAVSAERIVLDPECAPGPDVLGPDLEIAVTTW